MTKDYNELYKEKLESMKQSIYGTDIYDRLRYKELANASIKDVITKINAIISPQHCWHDTYFRAGAILGIMRTIHIHWEKRQKLFDVTGLNQDHLDMYLETCGNLPYLAKDKITVIPARAMQPEAAIAFIKVVAGILGYMLEDTDFYDITQERWDMLVANRLANIHETAKQNRKELGDMPSDTSTTEVEYEE